MNHLPCKAVIFDLDGTILDTLTDLTDSVNYALSLEGFPPRTASEVRSFLGNGMKRLLTLSVPEGTDEETFGRIFSAFAAHYKVHCLDNTFPYEGIPELLRQLRESGLKTAVVSNKGDFAVQEIIDARFPGLFDYVVGERPGISRKPAPDTVFACLKAFGLSPAEAVYIGDSEVDAETGRNAGMPVILVDWGFRDRADLEKTGVSRIASSPDDVPALILSAFRSTSRS